MTNQWIAPWNVSAAFAPALTTLEWALLLGVAAFVGQGVQRLTGLPKVLGYAAVGALAGLAGLAGATWPLRGVGLFLLELGIAVVLFEAGARLPLRWFRHNPMVLVQSAAESLLTFMAAYVALHALGLDVKVVRALSVIAVASSPAVLMRVVADLRANGPVTDRAVALTTLNTLYALTLGTAMLRSIDRGEGTMLASLAFSLTVLGVSALVGVVLAAVLTAAMRGLQATSEDCAIVILAGVAACVSAATPLGGSAPLAALLAGLALKQVHPRPWVWPRQLGTAATVLSIVMFVLVSAMAVRGQWSWSITGTVLALIAVRAGAKVSSLLATGFGTGMALRQTLWVSATLVPMSAVALLLTSQFVKASHSVGTQVAAIALPVILVTELLGAVMVSVALVRAGEAAAPWRRRKADATDATTGAAADGEARP